MINEVIEQIGGRDRLEEITSRIEMYGHGAGYTADEVELMARALLAVLGAKPVGVTISPTLAAMDEVIQVGIDVYTTPPAASAPDGLAAAVNQLLDSDGSRGTFSAIRRSDALAEIERLLAAAPATSVPDALREAVNAIYFTDSSDYFSALWSIVRFLSPETAVLLAKDERASFEQVNANLQHATAPAPGGDGG